MTTIVTEVNLQDLARLSTEADNGGGRRHGIRDFRKTRPFVNAALWSAPRMIFLPVLRKSAPLKVYGTLGKPRTTADYIRVAEGTPSNLDARDPRQVPVFPTPTREIADIS